MDSTCLGPTIADRLSSHETTLNAMLPVSERSKGGTHLLRN